MVHFAGKKLNLNMHGPAHCGSSYECAFVRGLSDFSL